MLTKTKATFVVLTARKLWQNRPPSSSPLSTAEPAATYTHTPTLSNLFSITDATIISLSLTLLSQREGKTVFVLMLLLRRSECEWILCKGVLCCCCCCFAFFLCSGFVACHRHQQRHRTTAARNILESVCFKYGTITSIELCECDFGTLCSAGHTISLTGTSSFVVASFSSFWE